MLKHKLFIFILLVILGNISACVIDDDCNHGICKTENNTTFCECEKGYVDYDDKMCNYQQFKKFDIFLISVCSGMFGTDWFYLSRGSYWYIGIGCIKTATAVIVIGNLCWLIRSSSRRKWIIFSLTLSLLGWISMWATDWIRVLFNIFPDGNGIALNNW